MTTSTIEQAKVAGETSVRARTRRPLPDAVYTALVGALAITLAEFVARSGLVSELILPAPSAVLRSLIDGFSSGLYWHHIVSTLAATAAGFAIATITAVLIAGILAGVPFLERVLMPFVVGFQTLPKIAVAPLIILWLGFDQTGKTFVVVIVCFFPILVNTLQGLRIRDRDQYELLKSLGASRTQLFRILRVPNALPYIFAGLHIGIIFALIGAIVSEFVGSRSGLGYILLNAKAQFNVPGVFAVLIILSTLGLTFHWIMVGIERRVAFWTEDISVVAA